MERYARHNLSDSTLLDGADAHARTERGSTADLLADIGEVEARKSYVKLAHTSLLAWCVERLRLSRPAALDRIRVARVARHFPAVFEMIADGRHNLTSIRLLAPYLTSETVGRPAEGWSKPDHGRSAPPDCPALPSTLARGLRLVYGQTTHDKLAYLRDLLSHQIPSGRLEEVVDRALEIAIRQSEKQKFAATSRPRAFTGVARPDSRHIPEPVKRAVWERDGGACTYVSEDGRRCCSTWQVEFHHNEEFALGGEATKENVRLLCRAHNQYLAECTYGPGFMQAKRLAAAGGGEARQRPKQQERKIPIAAT